MTATGTGPAGARERLVVVGNGMADDGGAKSGTFTLDLGAAPSHWHPTQCFVGQSGSGA